MLRLPQELLPAMPPIVACALVLDGSLLEVTATFTPAEEVLVPEGSFWMGCAPGDLSCYAAESPYARLLHEHLRAAGSTVIGPGTRPVHGRAIARTLREPAGTR